MLIDSTIIQRHERHEVLAQRHEVLWDNGTTIGLHPVRSGGVEHTYLRALEHTPLHWIVLDLRDLAPSLEEDIQRLPRRDAIGCVYHQLRADYPDAATFTVAALGRFKSAWFAGEDLHMSALSASLVARRAPVIAGVSA